MSDDSPHLEQKAEGSGIAQAAAIGEGATATATATSITIFGLHFNIPVEQTLISQLRVSIIIQWVGFVGVIVSLGVAYGCTLFYPICFTPFALYGLFMGYQLKSEKVKKLGFISGISSIAPWLLISLIIGPVYISNIIDAVVKIIKYLIK